MSQSEIIRPNDLGINDEDFKFIEDPSDIRVVETGLSDKIKNVIVDSLDKGIHASSWSK